MDAKTVALIALVSLCGCAATDPKAPSVEQVVNNHAQFLQLTINSINRLITCVVEANGDFKKVEPCLKEKTKADGSKDSLPSKG